MFSGHNHQQQQDWSTSTTAGLDTVVGQQHRPWQQHDETVLRSQPHTKHYQL